MRCSSGLVLVLCTLSWALALTLPRDRNAVGFVHIRRSAALDGSPRPNMVKRMNGEALAAAATHLDTLGRKYEFFAQNNVQLTSEHAKDFQALQTAASHMHAASGSSEAGLRDLSSSSYGAGYLPATPHSPEYRSLSPEEVDRLTESVRADLHHRLTTEVQPVFDYHAAKLAQTEDELQNVRNAQEALKNSAWYKNKAVTVGAAGLAGLAISDTAYQVVNNHRNAKMNQHVADQDAEIAALKAKAASGTNTHAAPASANDATLSPATGSEAPSTQSGATAANAPPHK